MSQHQVTFRSDGLELAGHLYLPDGDGPHAAVVLTGPFSSVKEQVTGKYAARLAERGIAALAFDHRGWGASGGEPRNHEDARLKVADLRDAVGYLATHPQVDAERITVGGVCLGGEYATLFAAFDPRVKALALIGSSYNNPERMRERFGPAGFQGIMEQFAEIAQRQYETGEIEYWPAVNPDGMPAGMPGPEPYSYYGTERGERPGWENRCTALSVKEELTITARHALPMLAPRPVLIVHAKGDQAVPPSDAEDAYQLAGEPKELVLLDGATNHVDIYDRDHLVNVAVDTTAAWLGQHLS